MSHCFEELGTFRLSGGCPETVYLVECWVLVVTVAMAVSAVAAEGAIAEPTEPPRRVHCGAASPASTTRHLVTVALA